MPVDALIGARAESLLCYPEKCWALERGRDFLELLMMVLLMCGVGFTFALYGSGSVLTDAQLIGWVRPMLRPMFYQVLCLTGQRSCL